MCLQEASQRTTVLIDIASRTEFKIGFNGMEGFLYESAKDNIRWGGLSVKKYIHTVMTIGRYLAMTEENWMNHLSKVRAPKQSAADTNKSLLALFS